MKMMPSVSSLAWYLAAYHRLPAGSWPQTGQHTPIALRAMAAGTVDVGIGLPPATTDEEVLARVKAMTAR